MSIKTYCMRLHVTDGAHMGEAHRGDFIRVADLAQYAVALEVAVNDGDHAYSSLSADQVDQLRALLAAVTGGNNG